MCKAVHGGKPTFTAVSVGQCPTLDVGFMIQKSNNAKRAAFLTGINVHNAYYSIYDFHSELVFSVTVAGKTQSTVWLHLLLARIVPRDTPRKIFRMDLGG
jgi:hypothetical protein